MDIIIPTYGRSSPEDQHTLNHLMRAGIKPTLVVQYDEHRTGAYDVYSLVVPVHVLPPHIKTVAHTRDYIIHDMNGDDDVLMLDDDLDFAARREDDPTKFRQMTSDDIGKMLQTIEDGLDRVPHVGIGPREGGNRNTEDYLWNTRIMRVLGYQRSYLRKKLITFSPLVVMEDFHVSLQILENGQDIMVCNNWVSNQHGGSGAAGGCSAYRTPQVQTDAANMLAARHPGVVRVVQKATKTAWGGGTRTDVVVQWKKARQLAEKRKS